ncbi:ammonia channel precursor [Variibacter gotjawalensis]|uniref:Ammonium transporter n=1 Tax=Variibacter gotjawalensis TaxID=1333996 RepID=A0A0S3PQI5_9BRAD|nr:ammonium transporter [Variibacter gotjawalensis]NIK48503.1 Amt family ammonium transporter [Variibacter gotjawalensis]RZS50368.1 ammonium transporter [Variibacter gotjawalensis]BAT58203.1 ammonia channel precursor [Variibacter gotjawalensis]
MKSTRLSHLRKGGGILAGVAASLLAAAPAFAQAAAEPTVNKGDTAWMIVATVLVLLMTIPGLALFYGGLVRAKNMLSVLMHVFYCVCVVTLIWVIYGYSLAFTGGSSLIGGFSKAFMAGITPESKAATFTVGVAIPEYVYLAFQMTFACITPALIVGAFAERMRFAAVVLFVPLWVTFVYFPIAHMVWYWAGPDAIDAAAKVLAAATDEAAKTAAQAKLDEVNADSGLIFQFGALDFAGGTVVHINAGLAGLIGALIVGKRIGYGKELLSPHSLTLTMVGAALLWVGWFGFNAGSNLEAAGGALVAMINTFVATAAAALAWMFVEWAAKGKPSLLGVLSGAVAGLVAVTPASGFAGPMGSIVLGLVAGAVCFFFCTTVKNAFGYDDSLDVFGVHCVGGIVGAILTGVLVSPSLGGTGVVDYAAGGKIAEYVMSTQVIAQLKAVGVTILWSGIGSAIIFKVVDLMVGLRATPEAEREGLDLTDHGERAYTS